MEENKKPIPKFKIGDKVKIMRDEVFTVDEVITTERKNGITHEYYIDEVMDFLQENELILVEPDPETSKYVMTVDGETTKSPKELLKDGMFGLDGCEWYVVAGDNFVGKDGGYNPIADYDENLYLRGDKSFSIDVIVEADSFDSARDYYKEGLILWKRK